MELQFQLQNDHVQTEMGDPLFVIASMIFARPSVLVIDFDRVSLENWHKVCPIAPEIARKEASR